jgi:hypothetical protein
MEQRKLLILDQNSSYQPLDCQLKNEINSMSQNHKQIEQIFRLIPAQLLACTSQWMV